MFRFLWNKAFNKRTNFRLFWLLALVLLSPVVALQEVRQFLGMVPVATTTPLAKEKVEKLKEVVAQTVSRVIHRPVESAQAGPIRVYFTQPGTPPHDHDIAHVVAGYVNQAVKTLDVAAYELNNKVITEALVNAVRRGVRVRLVTETSYLQAVGTQALKAVGVPVVDDKRDGALMHDKFMVFDNRAVWTGSMNFTENCAYKNNNHGLFLENAELAANYATKFSWMFDQHKFGGAPGKTAKIPYPVVALPDGTIIENYFSTHDHIANHLMEKIGQSQRSIHFLAFSYTHDGIGKAMLARARAGVPVQGVFEKMETSGSHSEYEKMKSFGNNVQVYLDANPRFMHHKVILLDNATTVAGSFNFSEGADKKNDENIVVIHNQNVTKQFEEEFQRVYGAAAAVR